MSGKKHSSLIESGLKLFVFKAVSSDNADPAAPVVWIHCPNFGARSIITWQERYRGYLSNIDIEQGNIIAYPTERPVDLGHGLKVIETDGKSDIVPDPYWEEPGWINIDNQTSTIFTVGLEQAPLYASADVIAGDPGPICAFRTDEHPSRRIKPLQQVLFMFSTSTFQAGTILTRATDTHLDGCLAHGGAHPEYPLVEYTDDGKWNGGETVHPDDIVKACIQPEKSI